MIKRYLITDSGAVGDGQTLNTKAIQAAIDRCSGAGGGVVVVPKGTFLTGALFLKKSVNQQVEKGGVLLGSVNQADYPQVHTRWEGVEREWTAALINADGLSDFELSGDGTIDGNGEQWVQLAAAQRRPPGGVPSDSPAVRAPRLGRPRLICIENCRFGYGHGGVAMGSETSGGIRHVEVRNCIAEAGNWAFVRFKSQPSRGGIVEDIVYRDLQIRDVRQVFDFNMEWRMVAPLAPPAKVLPLVRNVKLINISGTATAGGIIHGLAGSPIENLTFKNCNVTTQKGLLVEHARRVDFSGLSLVVKEGEPIVKKDVE